MPESQRLFRLRLLLLRVEALRHRPTHARRLACLRECQSIMAMPRPDGFEPVHLPGACRALRAGDVERAWRLLVMSERRLRKHLGR